MAQENNSNKSRADACGGGMGTGLTTTLTLEDVEAHLRHAAQWDQPTDILRQLLATMQREAVLRKALESVVEANDLRPPMYRAQMHYAKDALKSCE